MYLINAMYYDRLSDKCFQFIKAHTCNTKYIPSSVVKNNTVIL